MSCGKIQKREIATIKKRTITLSLSDADCERIAKKADSAGMTVGELLENFIGDLVDGTYSNGSDECYLANQWFERCEFGMFPENTLLKHLIDDRTDVEKFLDTVDDIKTAEEDLKAYKENPEEYDKELNYHREQKIKWRINMNKVPEYLRSIVNTLKDDDGILIPYSSIWLDEWLNISKIREKYGEDWKKNYTAVVNHSKAVGYMEAIGALHLYKLKH